MRTTRRRTNPAATVAPALLLLALGLWLPSEASAQWTTSGTNTTTTNNVGVGNGVGNPTSKLEVGGQADNLFRVASTGSAATDTVANFTSAAGNIMIVRGNGNVGFGTMSPQATLHVQRDNNGDASLYLLNAATGASSRSIFLLGEANSNSRYGYLGYFGANYPGFANSTVLANGGVGGLRLYSYGGQNNAGGAIMFNTAPVGNNDAVAERMRINAAGNVGIGTNAPADLLHVHGTGVSTVQVQAGSTYTSYLSMWDQGSLLLSNNRDPRTGNNYNAASPGAQLILGNSGDGQRGDLIFQTTSAGTTAAVTELVRFKASGNVGVGTAAPAAKLDVNAGSNTEVAIKATGAINATGAVTGASISATYQDVAEWVPSVQKLSAGTVVVLDAGRTNHVLASSSAYDTKVAGVVSAQPGVILGVAGEGKLMVATTGRVKVKVDATRDAIRVGDLLVTSGVGGLAMRSVPVELGGTQIHRPGTIIGKALEPLEKGTGEILVLLSLQ